MAALAVSPVTCRDVIGMLIDYVEATLSPEIVAAFERHLHDCPPCVAYLNTYRRTLELTGRAIGIDMPEEMKTRLRDLLLGQLGRRVAGRPPEPGRD